ncbi:L-cysteine desulfidase family protein [Anaerosalibacter bizertensis]|uniref:L-cysteine desulfidase family protein n=1 Tax=Anaerosalibacter bizertensis TaxID=932217 RepID=UPI001D033D64|nr:L-serine ammonia-lyase, iron-sulfur-dependent, subunit alpha [Anaerosalibacter bizertensis]MCB5559520.1 L-serine ammonia-lyase, iron-sulfur-dependent, subunit alpha [Anaerosalibacter bizertensis]MCG4585619.1 L-serine ammonia-lyase, iron-sulfur-dependent, subunit alpha [Anaerosalibacter bizertensis]
MMDKKDFEDTLLKMVKKETIPAIGCTEPVAVAYASAVAKKYLNGKVNKIRVNVSLNIFKNGKFVIIPKTSESGLELAAALGAVCGVVEEGLCVLKNVNEEYIKIAKNMVKEEKIILLMENNTPHVYVKVVMENEKNNVEVILKDSHDHIEKVKLNGKVVYEDVLDEEKNSSDFLKQFTLKEFREICESISIEKLDFIEDGIEMNKAAAEKGIEHKSGLGLGCGLSKFQQEGKVGNNPFMKARILTAAGADFRMGGGDCPIMTSGGSGNQGLGVILPIVAVYEYGDIEREKLIRAIFYGHIINKFVKSYVGKLSALCGCAISAGVGASAAITWMLGGNDEQISGSVQNMLANLTGMVCDGAKETCTLKLSTSAGEAVLSSYLALDNIIVKPDNGILGTTAEETIENIGVLSSKGMSNTDKVIVDIMNS